MRLNTLLWSAGLALGLAACGQIADGASADETAPPTESAAAVETEVSAEEKAAAIAHIGLPPADGGQVVNDCEEAVTPSFYAVALGGDVGRAILVVVSGGPNTFACYGMTGMKFFLLRPMDGGLKTIFTEFGHFAVMESAHLGVRDIAVGGPGFEFPVYEWNGEDYVQARTIPDTEFPESFN